MAFIIAKRLLLHYFNGKILSNCMNKSVSLKKKEYLKERELLHEKLLAHFNFKNVLKLSQVQ